MNINKSTYFIIIIKWFFSVFVTVLGKEAAEARNKIYRYDRLHHACKTSRIATMTDLFYRSINCTDLVIASQGNPPKKKFQDLPATVKALLAEPLLPEPS